MKGAPQGAPFFFMRSADAPGARFLAAFQVDGRLLEFRSRTFELPAKNLQGRLGRMRPHPGGEYPHPHRRTGKITQH